MNLQRSIPTLAAFAACGMMLALIWRDPDPWHGPAQIAIVPLIVGGIGCLQLIGRDARLRILALAMVFGLAWPGLAAMMAPQAPRWTALVIAVVGAVGTVLGTYLQVRRSEHA